MNSPYSKHSRIICNEHSKQLVLSAVEGPVVNKLNYKNYKNKVQNVQNVQKVQTPFFVSRCYSIASQSDILNFQEMRL